MVAVSELMKLGILDMRFCHLGYLVLSGKGDILRCRVRCSASTDRRTADIYPSQGDIMALARSCTLDANPGSMCKVAGVAVFELSEGARMLQILQGAYDPLHVWHVGFRVRRLCGIRFQQASSDGRRIISLGEGKGKTRGAERTYNLIQILL
jgi:hypothetical protein